MVFFNMRNCAFSARFIFHCCKGSVTISIVHKTDGFRERIVIKEARCHDFSTTVRPKVRHAVEPGPVFGWHRLAARERPSMLGKINLASRSCNQCVLPRVIMMASIESEARVH